MTTHVIPDKVKAKVERMYKGEDRTRVIAALESGKTVHVGGLALKGTPKQAGEPIPAPPPPPPDKLSKKDKDKSG